MTEPTYEVNFEKLSSLSIADLSSLLTLWKLYPSKHPVYVAINKTITDELDKRINDIIIF